MPKKVLYQIDLNEEYANQKAEEARLAREQAEAERAEQEARELAIKKAKRRKKIVGWLITIVILAGIVLSGLQLAFFSGFMGPGKYNLTSYQTGSNSMPTTQESYVRLKGGYTAKVYVKEIGAQAIYGTGTWKKGDAENTYVISLKGKDYVLTVDGDTMTMTADGITYVFEKED